MKARQTTTPVFLLAITLAIAFSIALVGCENGGVSEEVANSEYGDCLDICMTDGESFDECHPGCSAERTQTIEAGLKSVNFATVKTAEDVNAEESADAVEINPTTSPYGECMHYCMVVGGGGFTGCHKTCKELLKIKPAKKAIALSK